MTTQTIEYIRGALAHTKGNDLERANHFWRNATDQQLDAPYGNSGKTVRQIWQEYKDGRAVHDAAVREFEEAVK